jgi:hypothetical protein
METGEWFCHSQCQRGGDIFALEEALTGSDFPTCKAEVYRLVGRDPGCSRNGTGRKSLPNENTTNSRSPQHGASDSQESAGRPEQRLPADHIREKLARDGFHAVAEHQYGSSLRKVRFEHQSDQQQDKNRPEKTFRWEHCVNGVWYCGDGGLPKPLYINDVFRERDQVESALGFEGEAKADLAGELGYAAFSFKDITPVQAAALVDCEVMLWPGKDESGAQQAENAARTIREADQIRSIKVLTPPAGLPQGGDIIDAVRRFSWDKSRVAQLLESARNYQPSEPAKPENSSKSADSAQQPEGDKVTQSQVLINCAAEAEFFHAPEGEAFACFPVGEHREIWPLKSKSCRRWLVRAFYTKLGKPPGAQAMQDALSFLEAKAQFDSPAIPVFTRVAPFGDAIYIDLGNDNWEAVEITNIGWKIVQDPPVRFRRAKGMQPLADPTRGRPISNLRSLINIGDDRNWILLLSWLVTAFRPRGPYPVLILQGEQGSAKSTTAKFLRRIIDPRDSASTHTTS